MNPLPLEQTDPEIAELIRAVANRKHSIVKKIYLFVDKIALVTVIGTKVRVLATRNDPCPCGSEKKLKKCCGK